MVINPFNLMLLAAFLALSFLFSGMEAGLFALSRLRIRQQMRAGKSSARVLHQFLEKPENFLWTIIVGNTLVNFAVLGWFFSTLYQSVSVKSVWFALWFVLVVVVFYTFFDLLPKMLFRTYPNRLCLMMAKPFRIVHLGLRPIVSIVELCARVLLRWTGGKRFSGQLFGNREELRQAMQESERVFSTEEQGMINRVLDLENITVSHITRPMTEVASISADETVEAALKLCRETGRTRLPVWQNRGGARRIAGILSVDDLLFATEQNLSRKVLELIAPGLFVEESARLDTALERLQRGGQRVAIVLGRDGKEVGIVGLEDILKIIFGEVRL
jgi:CBS domain containing-hemolysin-like protein